MSTDPSRDAEGAFPKSCVGEIAAEYKDETQDEGVDLIDVGVIKEVSQVGEASEVSYGCGQRWRIRKKERRLIRRKRSRIVHHIKQPTEWGAKLL